MKKTCENCKHWYPYEFGIDQSFCPCRGYYTMYYDRCEKFQER